MSNLTVGKIRGLQQIATEKGIFVMSAIDHRAGLVQMIQEAHKADPDYSDIVQMKLDICLALEPYSSAVLLDPEYGAAQCLAAGALKGGTGLLVSVEATGYEQDPTGRITTLLKDWSVEKVKRMGASAVKILVYYRPDIKKLATRQLKTIAKVASDCVRYDIPFLVEPKTYRIEDEDMDSVEFAAHLPEMVIETARQITALPVDVLKAEFPADMKYERDEAKMAENCRELDLASQVPWVILSAGVDYDLFKKQVSIACTAGASGFLGGRAIWQEAISILKREKRNEFLMDVAARRMQELAAIANRSARPWHAKLGLDANALAEIDQNWYREY